MTYHQPALSPIPLAQSELEQHLWEAANILRGPVDAADFKTYIFPLLFYKHICDVYDEEYQQALVESGGDAAYAQFPEHHHAQQDNLTIALYVRPATGGTGSTPADAPPALAEAITAWEQSSLDLRTAMADLFATLNGQDEQTETVLSCLILVFRDIIVLTLAVNDIQGQRFGHHLPAAEARQNLHQPHPAYPQTW